jgi:hypothetical protein
MRAVQATKYANVVIHATLGCVQLFVTTETANRSVPISACTKPRSRQFCNAVN